MAIGRVNTGGSGSGATLVITGVAGDTCTISKSGKTKTKTFDSSGKATFKGLDTGTWTVTMTNSSGSTATQTVTINADYTLTIAYFSATIAVTYPAGSTCTCVNGSTTLTAVGTTGSYTFTVPNTGTWTVSCTDGEDTASENVSITADGQSASVTLAYELVLYNQGAYDSSTGGWTGSSSTTTLTTQSHSSGSTFLYANNKINVSSYSTLSVRITSITSPYGDTLGAIVMGASTTTSANFAATSPNFAASTSVKKTISSATIFTVDISSLSGEYYIVIQCSGGGLGTSPYSSKVIADYVQLS